MHNLYVDRIRKKRIRGISEPLDTVTGQTLGVDAHQDDHVQAREIMSMIERLPNELRWVLLLVTVEDLTYAEVSQVLNIPIGTVMSRLSRARERVRREI
jgi:RNA polymerase sigma-70 factor (ECF subfamily)